MRELGILAALVGSALALRPKRGRGALDFLTGSRGSFLDLSSLATVATAAWGASELFGRRGPSSTTRAPEIPEAPRAQSAPPPARESARRDDGSELAPEMLGLVRLTIAAALCDGHFSPTEKQRLAHDAKAAGIEKLVARELDRPRPLGEICAALRGARHARDVYTLAFAVVRADEGVSANERRWLEELARELGLDRDATAELERGAIERIERAARA